MLHALRPAHLGDVYQPLDAGFEFHEGAVVRNAYDLAASLRPRGVPLRHGGPGVGQQLLAPERNAHFFFVELQDLHFDFLVGCHHFVRVLDARPGEIGDVQKAVEAAEIHEDAVVGDVLHFAGQHLAFRQRVHQRRSLGLQLFFQNCAPAHHHVAALAVQLGDAARQLLAHQGFEIRRRPDVVLRPGKKRAHADIHHQAALDAVHDLAGKRLVPFVGGLHSFPRALAQHLLVGEDGHALLALPGELHFNGRAGVGPRNIGLEKLLGQDQPFGFRAQIHDHTEFGVSHYFAFYNFAFRSAVRRFRGKLLDERAHLLRGFRFCSGLRRRSGCISRRFSRSNAFGLGGSGRRGSFRRTRLRRGFLRFLDGNGCRRLGISGLSCGVSSRRGRRGRGRGRGGVIVVQQHG